MEFIFLLLSKMTHQVHLIINMVRSYIYPLPKINKILLPQFDREHYGLSNSRPGPSGDGTSSPARSICDQLGGSISQRQTRGERKRDQVKAVP